MMVKLQSDKATLIFDARVIWASAQKSWQGYQVDMGIVTLTQKDKEKLADFIQ